MMDARSQTALINILCLNVVKTEEAHPSNDKVNEYVFPLPTGNKNSRLVRKIAEIVCNDRISRRLHVDYENWEQVE